MSAINQDKRFTHEPLERPSDQIRLLRLLQPPTEVPTDGCCCELTTFDVDDCPEYAAISYMWGEDSNTNLRISAGRIFHVRKNCWYALWQAWNYGLRGYIWIDSICINQLDDQEKSAQVAMMGNIYKNATVVLACIGPDADESHLVFKQIPEAIDSWRRPCPDPDEEVQWERDHFERYSRTALKRIGDAMLMVSRRAYFSRLWIIQELLLARTVVVCCGGEFALFEDLQKFADRLYYHYSRDCDGRNWSWYFFMLATGHESFSRERENLFDTMQQYLYAQCSDERDHVYGLLALVHWGKMQPLTPDYTLKPVELLQKLLSRIYRLDNAEALRYMDSFLGANAAMRIGYDCPDISELVQARRKSPGVQACRLGAATKDTTHLSVPVPRYWRLSISHKAPECLTVGRTMTESGFESVNRSEYTTEYRTERDEETWLFATQQRDVKTRLVTDELGDIALVSCDTHEGDLLVLSRLVKNGGLVLRQAQNGSRVLQIVGQAIFRDTILMQYLIPEHMAQPLVVRWDQSDCLAYMFQDVEYVTQARHNNDVHDRQNIDMLVERLRTPITRPDMPFSSFATWDAEA